MRTSVLGAVLVLMACGPSGSTGVGGGEGGGAGGGMAGGAGGGGGSGAATLSVSECETDMAKFEGANCADQSGWTMMKTTLCPKLPNATAALCETPLKKAKACHAQFQSATMVCTLGQTDSADPCAVDVLLGVLCVATMNSNQCAGISCMYNSDCPTGYACNDKTDRCVSSSASCIGLPCKYNADCPTGLTCNNGTGQCNK